MFRKRRVTASQRIVRVATVGMPSPVRAVLGTRIISTVLVLLAPLMLATGILTLEWDGFRPRFAWDKDRAREVGENAVDAAHQYGVPLQIPAPANGFVQGPWSNEQDFISF